MADPSMPSGRIAAVMFLDVVGYSAMMARDERHAMGVVREFEEIVRAQTAAAGGRLVKFLGDGSMIEFPTSRAAVACALAIQSAIGTRVDDNYPRGRFQVRIGIHVGDLLERDGDLFGDSVNIAARIQPLADPGGLALTGQVYDQVRSHLVLHGVRQRGVKLKNIPQKFDVFLMRPAGEPFFSWTFRKRRNSLAVLLGSTIVGVAAAAGVWNFMHRDIVIDMRLATSVVYASEGATIYIDGFDRYGIALHHRGTLSPGPYMGLVILRGAAYGKGNWTAYEGIRIELQSNPMEVVDLVVVEASPKNLAAAGEHWIAHLPITSDLTEFVLPFSAFEKAPWQPPEQDGDGVLELDRVLKLLIQPPASSTVLTQLVIKNLRLMKSRRSSPPEIFGAIAGPATGAVSVETRFSTMIRDARGVPVQCTFDWGDGAVTKTPFVVADKPISASHAWQAVGTYPIRAKVMNIHGATSGWSNPVQIAVAARSSEGVISTFEDGADWYVFGLNGAIIAMEQGLGAAGPSLITKIQHGGEWGVVRRFDRSKTGDPAQFKGIRVACRGTPGLTVNMTLVEQGIGGGDDEGEFWIKPLTMSNEWQVHEIPFESLYLNPNWQPGGADKNRKLDLTKIASVRFLSTNVASRGELSLNAIAFTHTVAGRPSPR